MRKGHNIIRFPNQRGMTLDKEFEVLIDDMGGWLWAIKQATHKTWTALGLQMDLSPITLKKVADRDYIRGPASRTFYKILRAADDRALIKHSILEKYRGFSRADAQRLDKAAVGLKKAASRK